MTFIKLATLWTLPTEHGHKATIAALPLSQAMSGQAKKVTPGWDLRICSQPGVGQLWFSNRSFWNYTKFKLHNFIVVNNLFWWISFHSTDLSTWGKARTIAIIAAANKWHPSSFTQGPLWLFRKHLVRGHHLTDKLVLNIFAKCERSPHWLPEQKDWYDIEIQTGVSLIISWHPL